MRKIGAIILALLLIWGAAAAEGTAAPNYVMEGYDGDNTGRTWETNLFFSRMREEYPDIRFMYRQAADSEEWKKRTGEIIEGKNLPDVLFKAALTPSETRKMYEAGVLINLKPLITEERTPALFALLQEHPEWEKAITLPGGAIAALPMFNTLQSNDFMWINKDWLAALKLKTPTTADELTEVLRAFKKGDPNRNGSADEIPLTFISMWELRFLGHAFGIIDNDYYISVEEDGTVTSALASDRNRAFLTWLHTLWTEGLLDHDGFSRTDAMRLQSMKEVKTTPFGLIMCDTPLSALPAGTSGQPTYFLDQYEIMKPLSCGGEQVYRDLTGDVIRGTFAITRDCADPARIMEWVDFLYSEKGALLAQYGAEGAEYTVDGQGMWKWTAESNTVRDTYLPQRTIGTGTQIPGIALEDFQLRGSDASARRIVQMMADFKPYSVNRHPYIALSDADASELARIQAGVMPYAELAMACFVTGDQEMNDANWNTFCETVHEKGLDDAVAIWQRIYDEAKGGN